jgi:formate hydrogenlyase subunit 7
MASWIGQSFRRGILTSRYPAKPATSDEVPDSGRPPRAPSGVPVGPDAIDACPVGAISVRGVDLGQCIRCARCLAHGFRFEGPVEIAGGPASGSRGPPAAPLSEFSGSVHVYLIDVGSCRACNLEVLGIGNPYYDASRLGIFFTHSPRHADVLVVVGIPTEEMLGPLRRTYEALPEPRAVLAVGACAIGGGAFRGNPGTSPLERAVPVDLSVPGCPPAPVQVLDGILRLAGRGRRGA